MNLHKLRLKKSFQISYEGHISRATNASNGFRASIALGFFLSLVYCNTKCRELGNAVPQKTQGLSDEQYIDLIIEYLSYGATIIGHSD
jgi:hypothetical protein